MLVELFSDVFGFVMFDVYFLVWKSGLFMLVDVFDVEFI